MEIIETMEGTIAVLTLRGHLDSANARLLEDVLPERVQQAHCTVLDLSGVQYVSSAGLRVMLKGAKIARSAGHTLVLASLTAQVHEVFQVSGFLAIFRIFENCAAALSALADARA